MRLEIKEELIRFVSLGRDRERLMKWVWVHQFLYLFFVLVLRVFFCFGILKNVHYFVFFCMLRSILQVGVLYGKKRINNR